MAPDPAPPPPQGFTDINLLRSSYDPPDHQTLAGRTSIPGATPTPPPTAFHEHAQRRSPPPAPPPGAAAAAGWRCTSSEREALEAMARHGRRVDSALYARSSTWDVGLSSQFPTTAAPPAVAIAEGAGRAASDTLTAAGSRLSPGADGSALPPIRPPGDGASPPPAHRPLLTQTQDNFVARAARRHNWSQARVGLMSRLLGLSATTRRADPRRSSSDANLGHADLGSSAARGIGAPPSPERPSGSEPSGSEDAGPPRRARPLATGGGEPGPGVVAARSRSAALPAQLTWDVGGGRPAGADAPASPALSASSEPGAGAGGGGGTTSSTLQRRISGLISRLRLGDNSPRQPPPALRLRHSRRTFSGSPEGADDDQPSGSGPAAWPAAGSTAWVARRSSRDDGDDRPDAPAGDAADGRGRSRAAGSPLQRTAAPPARSASSALPSPPVLFDAGAAAALPRLRPPNLRLSSSGSLDTPTAHAHGAAAAATAEPTMLPARASISGSTVWRLPVNRSHPNLPSYLPAIGGGHDSDTE